QNVILQTLQKLHFTMQRKPNFLERLSIYLIVEVHQKRLSPRFNNMGSKCRFYPSCSNYALMAIEKYGFYKGWIKAISRIWRCNPWNNNTHIDYP
ncbi:MAG: membrane protein insertion efficiency factor YidD, partial [Candidatus Micrarchaeota archaeon]